MNLEVAQNTSSQYDAVAVGYVRGIVELSICVLSIITLVVFVRRLIRCRQKHEKWLMTIFDVLIVTLYCILFGLYGIVCLIDYEDLVITYALVFIVVMTISICGVATLYRKQKEKQAQLKLAERTRRYREQEQKEQALEVLVKPKLKAVKLGNLGVFSTEKDSLGFGYLLARALERHDEVDAQISFVLETVEVWRKQIESHSQYIINYFMFNAIENTHDTDTGFWLDWNIDEKKYPNEKCLEIFHQKYDNIIKNEISEYLAKDTTKDIKELFQKHFPFFAYDEFTAGIMLENLSYDLDTFSIQISDKTSSVFCGAYEQFNSDLEGIDWHNF